MEKKAVFALVSLWFVFSSAKIRPVEKDKVNWLSLEEVNMKMKEEPRPVLIDLYTSWCYWCKVMDQKTYSDPKVIRYVNEHFYTIKLNAETTEPITWNGTSYKYNQGNKVNDFSLYVTQGQLAFPNTVIFPDIRQAPASIPGFMKPKDIEVILTYFGDGFYRSGNFKEYSENFKSTW
jgi:thioredoxin-related protein